VPGSNVGTDRWRIIAPTGTDIAIGGIVTNGAQAFLVATLTTDQGYPAGILDPTGIGDVTTAPFGETHEAHMQIAQSSLPTILLLMLSSVDDKTAVTGATVTAQLSAAGGAFAPTTNAVAEVGLGFYKVALTAAETATLGQLAVVASATGCNNDRAVYKVVSL
jgi:hypothetical protein